MERQESNFFPTYIKEDWHKSFIKEVGHESLDSMQFEVDGETFLPYYTADDITNIGGRLPKINDNIRLGEIFDLRNGNMPIKAITTSLQHGYNSPVFLIDGETSLDSLADIHLDYLFPRFELFDADAEQFIEELDKKYNDSAWQADITRRYGSSNSIDMPGKFIFEFDAEKSVLEFIGEFKNQLDSIKDLNPTSIILKIKFSGLFVKDIIKSRAIKIFWLNYLASRNVSLHPYLCEIIWELSGDYTDEVLFHTNNIIAATMAQADQIILSLNDEDEDRNRILRNSIHIALIESNLGDDSDPVAGSYFIEYVANALAEKAFALH